MKINLYYIPNIYCETQNRPLLIVATRKSVLTPRNFRLALASARVPFRKLLYAFFSIVCEREKKNSSQLSLSLSDNAAYSYSTAAYKSCFTYTKNFHGDNARYHERHD